MPRLLPLSFRQLWFLLAPHQSQKQSSSMSWTYRYDCLLLALSSSRVLKSGYCISLSYTFLFLPCSHTLLVKYPPCRPSSISLEMITRMRRLTLMNCWPSSPYLDAINNAGFICLALPLGGPSLSCIQTKCILESNGLKIPNTPTTQVGSKTCEVWVRNSLACQVPKT